MKVYTGLFTYGFVWAIALVVLTVSAESVVAEGTLNVLYQWKHLDFAWPDEETRLNFSHYIRENNNLLGIEVAGDRIFLTVPRWRTGVAATLNYIWLNDTSESPLLNPYPSWEAHIYNIDTVPETVSVFRVWADKCDRLWVLDRGVDRIDGVNVQVAPPTLIVYNLTTDQVIRKYQIPEDQKVIKSHFGNVVVEDYSCNDSYAYLADLGNPGIVVYSWANDKSWLVRHHYFHPDPLGGNFNMSGLSFQWWDGVLNLALAPEEDGYSMLYFHPLSSNTEFSVRTDILRDPELATSSDHFHDFSIVGSRGPNAQGAAVYLDPSTGVIFYALSLSNSIACWNPNIPYESGFMKLYSDDETVVFPADIKIDDEGTIWVTSNRLPNFMYGELDSNDYNYRVLIANVAQAVAGTLCFNGSDGGISATKGLFWTMVFMIAFGHASRRILL